MGFVGTPEQVGFVLQTVEPIDVKVVHHEEERELRQHRPMADEAQLRKPRPVIDETNDAADRESEHVAL